MIADAKICANCEHYTHQEIDGKGLCLHSLFGTKFKFENTEAKIRTLVDCDGDREKTLKILTTVPEAKCPFLLEQTVSPMNNHRKGRKP